MAERKSPLKPSARKPPAKARANVARTSLRTGARRTPAPSIQFSSDCPTTAACETPSPSGVAGQLPEARKVSASTTARRWTSLREWGGTPSVAPDHLMTVRPRERSGQRERRQHVHPALRRDPPDQVLDASHLPVRVQGER